MAKILLAVAPTAMPMMVTGLQLKHDLVTCLTLDAAKVILRKNDIDLVVCDIYFDGSQMFDLLRFVTTDSSINTISIVCVKATSDRIGSTFLQAADVAARSLGAHEFVDFSGRVLELGEDEAFERLHAMIQKLLLVI